MTEVPEEVAPGRLLLRLSTRRDAEAMLPVATQLGQAFGMRLSALFVEEEEAITASMLPIPNVTDFSGEPISATTPTLDAAIRVEAACCARLVQQSAKHAQLPWSFEAKRGGSSSVLLAACTSGDIAVTRYDRIAGGWREAFRLARMLAASSGGALILREAAPKATGNTMLVLGSGERIRTRAAEIADALSAEPSFVSMRDMVEGTVLFPCHTRLIVVEDMILANAEESVLRAIARSRASLMVLSSTD